MKNQKLADELKLFIEKNDIIDTRIYFDNNCYSYNHYIRSYELLSDIKATDYFEYGNNDTVSMSFEGRLYYIINGYERNETLKNEFNKIFDNHNCYYELGDAWNLSVYYN